MGRWAGLLLLIASVLPGAAQATEADERGAALCERAIVDGARRGGVPVDVLRAIALSETGRMVGGQLRPWPWAINREGEGHWFASRDEALAFARASVAAGRPSFDVGCFQINYNWHGHAFPSLEAMFDQEVAGTYAAQFLRSLQHELGDWSRAAGAYHSRTPERAERYRARFDRLYAGVAGTPLVVAAAEPEAAAEPAIPRKSRTRVGVRPKVINLAGDPRLSDINAARVAGIRVERGRTPTARNVEAEAIPADAEVTLSARNEPL
ncbi:lytic transglycosylase domain-containing protein [Amaricoccus sp.]|uniref:lytic transglycosylase domain-containing protein n=1 Tax=Amaricoccus sp. TaxID=1872485 RepID=UPI001B6CB104|nr:lytic transglycosylase domain-containing protein [Amaricoccus sp.]MBP6999918.1 lytic transglycosylase domain-containing protein [Amaricoccus sp.]